MTSPTLLQKHSLFLPNCGTGAANMSSKNVDFLPLPTPPHQGLMPGSDTLAGCLGHLTFSSVADLFVAYVICTSHIVQQGILVKVETQTVRIESF